jgi:hypothetical protein
MLTSIILIGLFVLIFFVLRPKKTSGSSSGGGAVGGGIETPGDGEVIPGQDDNKIVHPE